MKKIFILTSLLYLVSCAETAQELIENNKAEAEMKFNQFYACYDVALSVPPITEDKINWKTSDANTEYGSMNVYQIGIESFKDLSRPLDIPLDGTRRREHSDMAKLFNIDLSAHVLPHAYQDDQKYSYHQLESGESCTEAIHHFLNTKYLLINRLLEYSAPVYIGNDEYKPGVVHGDVLVFDVESHSLLGGYQLTVESSAQISLHEYSDVNSNLMAELENKVYQMTIEKFVDLTPSVKDGSFEF